MTSVTVVVDSRSLLIYIREQNVIGKREMDRYRCDVVLLYVTKKSYVLLARNLTIKIVHSFKNIFGN